MKKRTIFLCGLLVSGALIATRTTPIQAFEASNKIAPELKDRQSTETNSEMPILKVTQDSVENNLEQDTFSLTDSGLIQGVWGTAEWSFDNSTGTLTIGTGKLGLEHQSPWKLQSISATEVKKIIFSGPVSTDSFAKSLFSGLRNLEEIENSKYLDLSNAVQVGYMFSGDSKLKSLDVSNWNMSNVMTMERMFSGAKSLTSLDVSKWDTSNVKWTYSMFEGASSLQNLDVSNWNTSKVTHMNGMFEGASSLTALDVSKWDTGNVTTLSGTFSGTSSLQALDVSNWNTSKVTNMWGTFSSTGCVTLDVSKWDTSNVTTMQSMFSNSGNLTTLNVSNWDVSKVTNMKSMFYYASKLNNLDVLRWNTGSVTDMSSMFEGAHAVEKLEVTDWDTSHVTTLRGTFAHTRSLTSPETLDVSKWNTGQVTDLTDTFYGTKVTAVDVSNWNTANVTSMWSTFDSTIFTSLDISRWDTGKVTTMLQMFFRTPNLVEVDVSKWNTSSLKDAKSMFSNATSLQSVDVSNWDTSSLMNTQAMFANTDKLKKLDLSKWDTSNVTYMGSMFSNYYNRGILTTVGDLSKWNTDKVKVMGEMFSGQTKLESLDIFGWQFLNLITSPDDYFNFSTNNMFKGMKSLSSLTVGEHFAERTLKTGIENLPDPPNNEIYTGRWIGISPTNEGLIYSTSSEFMQFLNPKPGTYVWEKRQIVWDVDFDSRGGSAVPPQKVNNNEKVVRPDPPTLAEQQFIGWYEDSDLTKIWDFSTPVTQNLTLYAKWRRTVVDPEDGKTPLTPIDPETGNSENENTTTQDLRIQYVSDFDFGEHVRTVTGMQAHSAGEEGKLVDGTKKKIPSFISVIDDRVENQATSWELKAHSSAFKNEFGTELKGAQVLLSDLNYKGDKTRPTPTLGTIDISSSEKVVSTTNGQKIGAGTWSLAFGQLDSDNQTTGVTLNLPKGTIPDLTTYHATVDWELATGP